MRHATPLTLLMLAIGLMAVAHGAIFARLAAEAHPVVISAVRTGLAALVMLPLGLATGRAAIRAGGAAALRRALIGGAFLALHFASWIASLDHTSIVNSVILVSLTPVWLALYTGLVRRERMGRATLVSVGLSIVGTLVIGLWGTGGEGRQSGLLGDALAVAGGICLAGYFLTGQRAMVTAASHRLPLLAYLGMCYAAAGVLLWAAVLAFGLQVGGLSETTYLAMIGAGLVSQVIGHSTSNWALRRFSPRFVAVCLLAEPVVTTVLGFAYFGEGVRPLTFVGGVVILAAIYIGALGERAFAPSAAGAPGP